MCDLNKKLSIYFFVFYSCVCVCEFFGKIIYLLLLDVEFDVLGNLWSEFDRAECDDYGSNSKEKFFAIWFSGRWGTGMLRWNQERGRRCMWKTLRQRVGSLKGNAEDWSICSSAAMLRTMLCGFVCNRVVHLVLPWPCRSLLCSCWVRLLTANHISFASFPVYIAILFFGIVIHRLKVKPYGR